MSKLFMAGAETGDLSEASVTSGSYSAASDQTYGGGYSYKRTIGTGSGNITFAHPTSTSLYYRFNFRANVTTPPSANVKTAAAQGIFHLNAATTQWIELQFNTNSTLILRLFSGTSGSPTQIGSDISINANQWYCIELKTIRSATVGVAEMRINQVVVATGSGLNTGSSSITLCLISGIISTLNGLVATVWWDDLIADNASYPGYGLQIARQGKTGTPTYNAWTKIGGATSAIDWSDTPYSTTNACSSNNAVANQSMLVASFSKINNSSTEGINVIDSTDVINNCKVAVIAKMVTSANSMFIIRRISGTNTQTQITLTTADDYYDDGGGWSNTISNINSCEIGAASTTASSNTIVEDMWLMIDYTPVRYYRHSVKNIINNNKNIPLIVPSITPITQRLDKILGVKDLILRIITDFFISSDVRTTALNISPKISDSSASTDSIKTGLGLSPKISDSSTSTDSIKTGLGLSPKISDSSTSTDVTKINISVIASRSETNSFIELMKGNISFGVSQSDSILSSTLFNNVENYSRLLDQIVEIGVGNISNRNQSSTGNDVSVSLVEVVHLINLLVNGIDEGNSSDLLNVILGRIVPISNTKVIELTFSFHEPNITVKPTNNSPTVITVRPNSTIVYKS
jgi:hypothetical protein